MKWFRPDPDVIPVNPIPPVIAGLVVILVGIVGFVTWAAVTEIASAVVAPGTVKVLGNSKQVQTATGGTIREIAVRDGAKVTAGEVLIRLDDTDARSELGVVQRNYDLVAATVARLRAERDHAATMMTFPDDLLARAGDPDVAAILAGQRQLFGSRRAELKGQTDIQGERINQLEAEIAGLTAQSSAKEEQITVISAQEDDMRGLLDKKLVSRSQVLALQDQRLSLQGDKAGIDADIARDKRLIAEAELNILQIGKGFDKDVNDELGTKETDMFGLAEHLAAAKHAVDETVIRATESGIAVGLAVHTVGGVVQPGATLLEIVPSEDNLIIEARIRPVDMDNVAVGLPVDVVFPAFSPRRVPRIEGTIDYVSADALTDARTNASYYLAQASIDDGQLHKLGGLKLLPGMPAEVFVKTGDQTPLAYLTGPLRDSMMRAWREP